jgi:hypothetical protein
MHYLLAVILTIVIAIAGCATKPLPPVQVRIPTRTIEYLKEVKPLLEKRCTVCHSCYNSPCQLKLDSFEGTDRGASKRAIYNATRLQSMEPTRLFTDAQTSEEWRKKEFFSVTASTAPEGFNNSLMIQLLAHKLKNPKSKGEYKPDNGDLTCTANGSELADYLEKHPNRGMPFGFPPLKQDEFDLVSGWLYQGAKGPSPGEQQALETPKAEDASAIAKWEAFFNQDDPKYAMTARYIYEHLFLAHIKFGTSTNEFYEIVRSKTPPGAPLELIPSIRPYDDPGAPRIFYRFRKVYSTIVQKTHMVYELDDARMERYRELFIKPEWLQQPHLAGYEPNLSANPFKTFAQIPPRSRYQFLLDSSEYIIMTFIHGPVCKGQVALNVIDDHFWVMFMDPDSDLAVKYPGFLELHGDRLAMPTEKGSNPQIFSALTDEHRKLAIAYYNARQDFYQALNYGGMDYNAIWKGSSAADAPLLTVYRHFDSASVHRGALGSLPKTLWVIDYPLLERIYYALVAGFDIYGTGVHQLTVRLYMDRLRIEGESYFLDFMPAEKRREIMQGWNIGSDLKKMNFYPSAVPAAINFATADPKREFVENLINHHLLKATGIKLDPLNYMKADAVYPPLPVKYETMADYINGFRAVSRPGTPFVKLVNGTNSNLAYLRIRARDGRDFVVTSVVNRWHDNVAFLLGEEDRLHPEKDNVEFVSGMIGSYPNFFFDIMQDDVPDFLDLLAHYDGSPQSIKRLSKYGINRADDRFWDTYDWFQKRFSEEQPVRGGLLDLNRYYYNAE